MQRSARALTLSLLLTCCLQEVAADSYRCGRKLVRSGDSPADVLRVCGQPLRKDRSYEKVQEGGAVKSLPVERWYYRQGRRSLEHMVIIYRGKVVAITAGSR